MANRPPRTGTALYAFAGAAAGCGVLVLILLADSGTADVAGIAGIYRTSAAAWALTTLPLVLAIAGWQYGELAWIRPREQRAQDHIALVNQGLSGPLLAQAMVDAVLLVDPEGTVVHANPAAHTLFEARDGDLLGLDAARLVPAYADLGPDQAATRLLGERSVGDEFVLEGHTLGGGTFPASLAAGPSFEGNILLVIRPGAPLSGADPGLRTRLSEAIEERDAAIAASRAKSAFVAEMSHELRTPLNAIIGYAELAGEEVDDPLLTEDLDRITRSGRTLLSLINDLLDLSKIEAGAMSVLLEPIRVGPLVDDVLATLKPLADKGGNGLEVDLPHTLPRVRGDSVRLRQALINLVGNACKFTADGTIRISAEADRTRALPGVEIRVSDTGSGMTADQLERAFQPFVQVDETRRDRKKGTGLGLPLARRFVEMMGGELTGTSTPGEGTTFRIWLTAEVQGASLAPGPAPTAAELAEARARMEADAAPDPEHPDIAAPGLRTLLVVDGDPQRLRLATTRALGAFGFEAVFGELDADLPALVQHVAPDAVLLDPTDLDQVRACAGHCPLVVLSSEFDLEEARGAGANYHLPKPPDWDTLVHLLAPR